MSTTVANTPKHVVAMIGGAVAGSTAAQVLADAGVIVVVFEQNVRPYGKIEDGLPRWHTKQRLMEYERINSRLDMPGVFFVPNTRLGRDVGFQELIGDWGFSAVILANGAWKDRPLPAEIDKYLNKGLIYQNPFIYWFNHKNEKAYSGLRYEIPGGTIVIGGGLASIDVVKAVQVEQYEAALRTRGLNVTTLELEHKGIPAVCKDHQINPDELGVQDVVLYYRRRDIDMPLAQAPDNATPEQLEKTQNVRMKILGKVIEKYRVVFKDRHLPLAPLTVGDRLAGIRFQRTQVERDKVTSIPGSEVDIPAPLVISSVGSIPEPIPGVDMKGESYTFKNWDTGEYAKVEGVFGLGNVVTGQGNIDLSRKHAASVSKLVLENYLGVGNGNRDISAVSDGGRNRGQEQAEKVKEYLQGKEPLLPEKVNAILARVGSRMREVGYTTYREYILKVTPSDLE